MMTAGEFCIKNDEFILKMMKFVSQMMHFVLKNDEISHHDDSRYQQVRF